MANFESFREFTENSRKMTSFRQVVSYLSGKTSASATPHVSAWETGNRCRCSQIGGIRHTCAALRCMKGLPSRRMFCGNCFRRRNCFRHRNCFCHGNCLCHGNCFCRPRSVQAPEPSRLHVVGGLQIGSPPLPTAACCRLAAFQPPASSPLPLRPLLGFLPTADPVRPLPSATSPSASPPG